MTRLSEAPRLRFHAVVAIPAGGMLWAFSTPGLNVLWFAFCGLFVAVAHSCGSFGWRSR